MPKITIPSHEKQWTISYPSDYLGDVTKSQNVIFDDPFGAPSLAPQLLPHTVTQDVAAIGAPTDFQRAKIDATDSQWAVSDKLYRVAVSSFFVSHFAADTILLSPTAMVDGDMSTFGKTVGANNGRDIMVVSSQGSNLSFYDGDNSFNTPTWRNDWWTGKTATITTISIASPQVVTTSPAHGYSTGDMVIIQGSPSEPEGPVAQNVLIGSIDNTTPIGIHTSGSHGFQAGDSIIIKGTGITSIDNATFVISASSSTSFYLNNTTASGTSSSGTATEADPGIAGRAFFVTVTASTTFTIVDTLGNNLPHGPVVLGTSYRIFDTTNQESSLGQLPLTSGIEHPLLEFGNAPNLFILDGNLLHSIQGPIEPPDLVNNPTVGDYTDYTRVTYARLTFKQGYVGNWIQATPYYVYIGLRNPLDDSAPSLVEEYDPFSEQVREFTIDEGRTTGYVQDDSLHIVDHFGQLRNYNGSGFDDAYNFPAAYNSSVFNIHRNGITPFGKFTLFNLPSVIDNNGLQLGGVWQFSPDSKNLYHRSGPMVINSSQDTFGSPYVPLAGAISYLSGYPTYMAGMTAYQTLSAASAGIWVSESASLDGAGSARGFFITSKIPSPEIDAVWRNFLVDYNMNWPNIGTQQGTIVVKYKTSDATYSTNGLIQATWQSSNTFSTYSPISPSIGDEVWVVSGNGAGASAHITLIASANTVFTLDEALLSSPTGDFDFIVDNWKKIPYYITDTTKQRYLDDVPTSINEWIRFKVELRASASAGPRVEGIQLGYQSNLMVEK